MVKLLYFLSLACAISIDVKAQDPCAALPPASSPGFTQKLETFMVNFCYQKQNWRHDGSVRTSDGVHPFVKVWYSPSMFTWMTQSPRDSAVPDGAMVVKEMYHDQTAPLSEWTIIVKDHNGAFDGWYWDDLGVPGATAVVPPAPAAPCPEAQLNVSGFGQYCLNCHASAAAGQSTYSTTSFLNAPPALATMLDATGNPHVRLAHLPGSGLTIVPNSACMVPESFDHVVAGGKPAGPQTFLTSDQCTGCHNATGTLTPARPDLASMLWPSATAPEKVNLSVYGEWRYSMMGLAGRDPIFFSQLNSETTLHPVLQDHPGEATPFIQDLCLHCHGVLGERQYKTDTGKFFTRDQLLDANSPYGALARDGISCTACHRIAAEGLGTPATYTGNFKIGPPTELYGPYDKDIVTLPMKNTLGIEPKSTTENQIQSSKLCGSCHTILLPIYNAAGKPKVDKDGNLVLFAEQATFLEWLNSSFADNGPTPKSCQDCHMPTDFKGNKLSYKIANIEDDTFPTVDFRAPDRDITLTARDPYYRHLLLGINVFALEMFRQFRNELGLYKEDPMLRDPQNTSPGVCAAIAAATNIASGMDYDSKKCMPLPERTGNSLAAQVEIAGLNVSGETLQAAVKVTNLAGHSFPSGVGFRRAFLNFQVLDENNKILWESGGTTSKGVIVDGFGRPLVTEYFTPTQQTFQEHHWVGNPITRQSQVQIYEELVKNPEGLLTTSFIALDHKAKDNRLQPLGWSFTGPDAEETGPVGTCVSGLGPAFCDPGYQDGSGSNVVSYLVPMRGRVRRAASVRATLYYQTIPPYYLQERARDATGTDTERLIRFSRDLNVEGTPVQNWKLTIASANRVVGQ